MHNKYKKRLYNQVSVQIIILMFKIGIKTNLVKKMITTHMRVKFDIQQIIDLKCVLSLFWIKIENIQY